jgi:hypothetical protein
MHIEELSTELEGDIDLQGLRGVDNAVSVGYQQIRIKVPIKADCTDEELDDLLAFAHGHSPGCNTVCRPVPLILERVKNQATDERMALTSSGRLPS